MDVLRCRFLMKPKGGRGKKAPYETTVIRVPVPIRAEVESLIKQYQANALENDKRADFKELVEDYQICLDIVTKFIDEHSWTEKVNRDKPTRDFTNLVRFMKWLKSKIEAKEDE